MVTTHPLTPNVVATFNFEIIQKFFLGDNKAKSLEVIEDYIQREDPDDLFILSTNSSGRELVKFVTDYAFSGPDQIVTRFTFIDSIGDFEKKFIPKTVADAYYGSLIRKIFDNERKALTEDDRKKIFDIIKDRPVKIYFAYGVGEDVENWAGPFIGTLSFATTNISAEGLREIQLEFINEFGGPISVGTLAEEKEDRFRYNRLFSLGNPIEAAGRSFLTTDQIDGLFGDGPVDIHTLIKEAINNYMAIVSENRQNQITLLPDLKKFLNIKYKEIVDKYTVSLSAFYFNRNMNVSLDDVPEQQKIETLQQLKDISKVEEQFDLPYANTQDLAIKVYALQEVLRALGMDLVPSREGEQTLSHLPSTDLRAENGGNSNISQQKLAIKFFVNTSKTNDEFSDASDHPNYFIPFKEFMTGLQQISNFASDFMIYEESDLNIIKLWEKFNIIPDGTKSVVVFGEEQLISSFLTFTYGSGSNLDKISVKMPIHKSDGAFASKEYLEEFTRLVNESYNFNEIYNTGLSKDEFAFIGEEAEFLTELINANIPIFRSNTRNANVLGMSIDSDSLYFNAVNYANQVKRLAGIMDSASLEAEDKAKIFLSEQKINRLYELIPNFSTYTRERAIEALAKEINSWNLEIEPTVSAEDVATFVLDAYEFNRQRPDSVTHILKDDGINPVALQYEILNNLSDSIVTMTLKTLPMLKISGIRAITTPAILLAVLPVVAGVSVDDIPEYSFHTGVYTIKGFRHVIDESDVFSEFALIRDRAGMVDSVDTQNLEELKEKKLIPNPDGNPIPLYYRKPNPFDQLREEANRRLFSNRN